jgi:hypothetical protein
VADAVASLYESLFAAPETSSAVPEDFRRTI